MPCQSSSIWSGSRPTRKRSCSSIAAAIVCAFEVTLPSPSPVRPSWSVYSLTKTQLPPRGAAATTNVFRPVIFTLPSCAWPAQSSAWPASDRLGAVPPGQLRDRVGDRARLREGDVERALALAAHVAHDADQQISAR